MIKKFIPLLIFITIVGTEGFLQEAELYTPINIQKAYEKGTRSKDGKPGPNYWQNRADYSMKVKLDPATPSLSGNEVIHYYNNSPDTLYRIVFQLYPDMYKTGNPRDFNVDPGDEHDGVLITGFSINGKEVEVSSNSRKMVRLNTGFIIFPKDPIPPGSITTLKIEWSFELNDHSHQRSGRVDESSFFIAYFFPRIAVYDDISGWNYHEYKGISEFYNDYGDFEVEIEVPDNWLVWATGLLQNPSKVLEDKFLKRYQLAMQSDEIIHIINKEEAASLIITPKKSSNKWVFKAENVSDFAFGTSDHYLWDASSLVVDKKTGRRVFIDAAFNKYSNDFFRVAEIARESVKIMSDDIPGIPFPFPQITVFNGLSEMEYPMMVNDMSVGENMVVSLTAHEIFHSYFPFYVGINETSYAWMDEGWATFSDYLIASKIEPENYHILYFLDDYIQGIQRGRDIPIIANSHMLNAPVYHHNSYAKSSVFNLILKDLLGEELFYESLREYIKIWNGKHPVPNDFFYTFNKSSGQSLNWLFQPWFFDFGYPDLGIKEVIKSQGTYKIVVQNLGHYPIPVHLKIWFSDGSVEEYHETADVWKNKVDKIQINIPANKKINKINLGTDLIPDADQSNNIYPQ